LAAFFGGFKPRIAAADVAAIFLPFLVAFLLEGDFLATTFFLEGDFLATTFFLEGGFLATAFLDTVFLVAATIN
jgi:hypothetical protein